MASSMKLTPQTLETKGNVREARHVALDNLHAVVARQKLDVERPGDAQGGHDIPRDVANLAERFEIGTLGRQDQGGVPGVHACVFDVLGDGVGEQIPVPSHAVELDLLGVFDELRQDDRVFQGDGRGLREEAVQLVVVAGDAHRLAAEDVGGTDQDGVAHAPGERPRVFRRGEFLPDGLVDPHAVKQGGEEATVFRLVDHLRRRTQDA